MCHFQNSLIKSIAPFDLINSDTQGPYKVKNLMKDKYFIILNDDHARTNIVPKKNRSSKRWPNLPFFNPNIDWGSN